MCAIAYHLHPLGKPARPITALHGGSYELFSGKCCVLQLSQFTVEEERPWTASRRRLVIAISFSRDKVNSMQYKCVLSRQGANEGLSASEIKGGYSSCWWFIDTQDTGCMSKLPIRATSLKSYIFPQVMIACVFAIFSFKTVSVQFPIGIHFGGNIKRHGKGSVIAGH